jgi:hypothetical protein
MDAKLKFRPYTRKALEAILKQGGLSGRERRILETALALTSATQTQTATKEPLKERERILVIVESNGDVSVLGNELEVECELVHIPKAPEKCDWIVEKIVNVLLPEDFREMYRKGQVIAFGNSQFCLSPWELEYWFDKNPDANSLKINKYL